MASVLPVEVVEVSEDFDFEFTEDDLVQEEINSERLEFQVTDADLADWVVGIFKNLENERELLKKRFKILTEELDKEEQRLKETLLPKLEAWAKDNLEYKKKHRDLLHGRVGFKKSPAKLEVIEAPKLIEWCEENLP